MTSSNFYFNNFTNSMEQNLIEDLIVESMGIYGHQIYYCPRTLKNEDMIYHEDAVSEYNAAYCFDVYVRSYDNYEGDGTFLSKFNLEIRDQVTLSVARRTFYNEIGTEAHIDRPQEGDLVYSPMMKRFFVIKYVNNTPVFYQMGALQMWDLVCETWEYSSEHLNTGIPEIDQIEIDYSIAMEDSSILTQDGWKLADQDGFIIMEGQFDDANQNALESNEEFDLEADGIVDWTQRDPFSEDIAI